MNIETACILLELTVPFTKEQVKTQYKKKALIYHPDKNKDPSATEQFQSISEAANLLLNQYYPDETDTFDTNMSYDQCMSSFFNNDWLAPMLKRVLIRILEKKTLECVGRFDANTLYVLYTILNEYKEAFHLSDEFLLSFQQLYDAKQTRDIFIVTPSLQDLYDHSIYKWDYSEEYTFCIPMWHHELVFDTSTNDIYVNCIPELPENIWIDSYNHVHVEIEEPIQKVLDINGKWTIWRDCIVDTNTLCITKTPQIIPFYNKGIPDINLKNTYDDSRLCHVYIHLTLSW